MPFRQIERFARVWHRLPTKTTVDQRFHHGEHVKLMRLGAPGAERPAVRLDETTYIDVPDEIRDFDEQLLGAQRQTVIGPC